MEGSRCVWSRLIGCQPVRQYPTRSVARQPPATSPAFDVDRDGTPRLLALAPDGVADVRITFAHVIRDLLPVTSNLFVAAHPFAAAALTNAPYLFG